MSETRCVRRVFYCFLHTLSSRIIKMSLSTIVEKVRKGVIHIEYFSNNKKNEKIASGSGFMTHNFLVTNFHVFKSVQDSWVVLSSHPNPNDDRNNRTQVEMSYADFKQCLRDSSDDNHNDYAILEIPRLLVELDLYQFELLPPKSKKIGEPIALLGFPFEQQNLVCHSGTISSFYKKGDTNVIQIDASVNNSNSGGPLIDCETGEVLGIITRKGTGLSDMFDKLVSCFDQNIAFLDSRSGGVFISGIDPLKAFVDAQQQMKSLAKEIKRSANVGIGYAFSIDPVISQIDILRDDGDVI